MCGGVFGGVRGVLGRGDKAWVEREKALGSYGGGREYF